MFGIEDCMRPSRTVGRTTWSTSKSNAVLYLFPAQQLPEVAIRPSLFNFDHDYISKVADYLDGDPRSIGDAAPRGILGVEETPHVILPSSRSIRVSQRHYEELWSFMLTIDNAPIRSRRGERGTNSRLVYIGYVLPINGDASPYTENFGRRTFNDDALLLITHMTHGSVNSIARPAGSIDVLRTAQDTDVILPSSVSQLGGNRDYLLTPKTLLNGKVSAGDGTIMDTDFYSRIDSGIHPGAHLIDTSVRSPVRQLDTVYKGLRALHNSNIGGVSGLHSHHRFDTADLDRSVVLRNIDDGVPTLQFGLDVNKQVTLGELFREYPSLRNNIHTFEIPFDAPLEVDDGVHNPSLRQVWSSFLQANMPSAFSYYGLCDVAFRYCSCNPVSTSRLDDQPIVEVQMLGTMIQESPDAVRAKWEACLTHIEKDLFSLVLHHCGHFDLTVSFTMNNYTVMQLQLLDYDDDADGWLVHHGAMAPLITPMVGSLEHKEHNAESLDTLVSYVGTMDDMANSYRI